MTKKENKLGLLRPIDSNGKPMVLDGNVYRSKDTGETLSINDKQIISNDYSDNKKSIKIKEVDDFALDYENDIIDIKPIKLSEVTPDISNKKAKEERKPFSREELYFPDGKIKANVGIYNIIKEDLKNGKFVTATEGDYYMTYRRDYAPYNERSVFDKIPTNNDKQDREYDNYIENHYRELDEEDYQQQMRDAYYDDIEYQERKRQEEREDANTTLLLLMCDIYGW